MALRNLARLTVSTMLATAALAVPAHADTAKFVISPTSLDFGQVRVGATSVIASAIVRNVSDAPIVMDGSGGGTSSPFTSSNDCHGKTLPGERNVSHGLPLQADRPGHGVPADAAAVALDSRRWMKDGQVT